MNEGRIEADGPTAEIFQDEELLACCHLEKPLRLQKYPVCSTQRKASCKNCFS
jgi:cobalt/nickel transport system ATP-binding protein